MILPIFKLQSRAGAIAVALLATCAAAIHSTASAADRVPAGLTGAWSNEALTYTGNNEQTTLYLQADGHGLLIGSQAASRLDGADDGKPPPRAVVGFPVDATVDGVTLTLQPFVPGQKQVAPDPRMRFACVHDAANATLTCTGPDRKAMVMQRRGDTIPPEMAAMLQSVQF